MNGFRLLRSKKLDSGADTLFLELQLTFLGQGKDVVTLIENFLGQ